MKTRALITLATATTLAACSGSSTEQTGSTKQAVYVATTYNFGALSNPGSCLDAFGAGTGDGTQIDEWACNGTVAQAYATLGVGGDVVTLYNPNANKCIDVAGAGTADGTPIRLWDCNGSPAQDFVLRPAGNGFVNLVNPNSNKCLDVQGDNPANGTFVQLYDCNGTSAQLWNPAAVGHVTLGGGIRGSGTSSSDAGNAGSAPSCDASAWVYMGSNANACDGKVGAACGWTTDNEGQGYHCQTVSWGTGCEPGGATCAGGGTTESGPSGGTGSSKSDSGTAAESGSGTDSGAAPGSGSGSGSTTGPIGSVPAGFVLSPYKDTSINLNWNTNAITTDVSGASAALASDLVSAGGNTVTLAFATGECGSENWAGVGGAALAAANVSTLAASGVKYILSTGGAAGSFTCGTDAGFATFVNRWASAGLVGVDFDIEAGQSESVILALVARIQTAHAAFPGLRFSLTVATLANNDGGSTAASLGAGVTDSLNTYGDQVIAAVHTAFGSTWPTYVTLDLMVMDYGSPSPGVCVVNDGTCEMGQSALQAAYNLHDRWGVPYGNIELTPMIGQNDASSEQFTLADADTVAKFALAQGLAGVHFWSYDRDVDCAAGSASATCNSMGNGYAGPHGFLKRFLAAGL